MAITDAGGLGVSLCVANASTHEVKLVEQTLESGFPLFFEKVDVDWNIAKYMFNKISPQKLL